MKRLVLTASLVAALIVALAVEPAVADTEPAAAEPTAAIVGNQIVVSGPSDWQPYAFLDNQGEPKGILVDLWREIGSRAGIAVTFDFDSFRESLQQVETGRAQIQGGLVRDKALLDRFLFSEEFTRVKTLLFSRRGVEPVDLSAPSRQVVGVATGSFDDQFLRLHFPAANIRSFADDRRLLEAAANGDIDHFVADYPTGYYGLLSQEVLQEFVADDVIFTEGLHAAVAVNRPDLLEFVDAQLAKISEAERQALIERWLVPQHPTSPWVQPLLGAIAAAAVLLASTAHYLALRRAVARTRLDLRETVDQLRDANGELSRRANVDALTSVANRHRFMEAAEEAIEHALRFERPLTLAMLDIDAFKSINDSFGHQVGDTALRDVAAALQTSFPERCLVARIGGDEFVVLMPETNLDLANDLVAQARTQLSEAATSSVNGRVPIRASFGVAAYVPPQSLDSWMAAADRRLYADKAQDNGLKSQDGQGRA